MDTLLVNTLQPSGHSRLLYERFTPGLHVTPGDGLWLREQQEHLWLHPWPLSGPVLARPCLLSPLLPAGFGCWEGRAKPQPGLDEKLSNCLLMSKRKEIHVWSALLLIIFHKIKPAASWLFPCCTMNISSRNPGRLWQRGQDRVIARGDRIINLGGKRCNLSSPPRVSQP